MSLSRIILMLVKYIITLIQLDQIGSLAFFNSSIRGYRRFRLN